MQIDLSQCIKCQFVYLIVYYDVYYVVTIMYIYADDRNELNYKSVPNLHCMQTPPVLIFIAECQLTGAWNKIAESLTMHT